MSNSPKKDVPVAIHWVWVHVLPKAENKPMFLLRSRKHEEVLRFNEGGVITETLQDVSSSETHHEGYFCTTKSWNKLKKLAKAEWAEEKNKKSENKHISPQGFKFMSHFVREATRREVIWAIEERGKYILDLIGDMETDRLYWLSKLAKLQREINLRPAPGGRKRDKKDILEEMNGYKEKSGMKMLTKLINDHYQKPRNGDRLPITLTKDMVNKAVKTAKSKAVSSHISHKS
ncbi:hypothetical protein ACHAPF_000613 [Botrytis cinerea]|uniref:Uncharacterized protein n=1 Tax=Botryotinia fuckeliana (strain T4) TaxID=999810 RepID=G2Y944_BOTF4|nr:hypothetical protein BofuT4_P029960.1 [Botrytis cinerea T4]